MVHHPCIDNMAQKAAGSEATSVARSISPSPNWSENIHTTNPLSPWSVSNIGNRWQQPHSNISSNACDDHDHMSNISTASFLTNASNHSMYSSSAELPGDPMENNLWNQVLFVGNDGGDLHSSHIDNGENFLEVFSSKTLNPTDMFDPACDYLKKLDNTNWDFPNQAPSLDTVGINMKQMNCVNHPTNLIETDRVTTNVSDVVSTWSIAPPNPNYTCNISQIKHEMFPNSTSYLASYEPSGACSRPLININATSNIGMGYQLMGLNNSLIGLNNSTYSSGPISDARNLSDLISAPPNPNYTCNISQIKHEMFPNSTSYLASYEPSGACSRPLININATSNIGMGYQLMGLNNSLIGLNNSTYSSEPISARNLSDLISFKASESSSHGMKQGFETSSSTLQTKGSGRVSGTPSDGKSKRSEDNSEAQFKKSRHNESSNASSNIGLQAPKVKLGDKITALQQIVSPFGKTDTASVLLEAINYIRILQEQVQLLSDPYLKTSANKDINSWGSSSNLERKDKGEASKLIDLRSRGLCLVPISCTPQIYRENSGPDYWPPTYRGCLFQ